MRERRGGANKLLSAMIVETSGSLGREASFAAVQQLILICLPVLPAVRSWEGSYLFVSL